MKNTCFVCHVKKNSIATKCFYALTAIANNRHAVAHPERCQKVDRMSFCMSLLIHAQLRAGFCQSLRSTAPKKKYIFVQKKWRLFYKTKYQSNGCAGNNIWLRLFRDDRKMFAYTVMIMPDFWQNGLLICWGCLVYLCFLTKVVRKSRSYSVRRNADGMRLLHSNFVRKR